MKQIVILGAGTAGTTMANKLQRRLDPAEWRISVVDRDPIHYYQPGFLFVPFGTYQASELLRPKAKFLPPGVDFVQRGVETIEPSQKRVRLEGGSYLPYDVLIIATGCQIRPEQTPGLADEGWRESAFDFYTIDGAVALGRFLRSFRGGRLVLNVVEMPIKCPVAPLEFLFLADWHFHQRGIRDKVELVYATPLDGAFTKPRASAILGDILQRKGIKVITQVGVERVDGARREVLTYEGGPIPYDLLVSIPPNVGADAIGRSEIGNESSFVPTDPYTLRAKELEDVFVIGDATDVPASKAGSVAHFEAEVLIENVLRHIEGHELLPAFDGHANCFIESGFGKGMLIDFNYTTEPLPGKFPLPEVGPFSLLEESRMNHWGKMMFRWIYWNQLIRGTELPLETQMVMAGKRAA